MAEIIEEVASKELVPYLARQTAAGWILRFVTILKVCDEGAPPQLLIPEEWTYRVCLQREERGGASGDQERADPWGSDIPVIRCGIELKLETGGSRGKKRRARRILRLYQVMQAEAERLEFPAVGVS